MFKGGVLHKEFILICIFKVFNIDSILFFMKVYILYCAYWVTEPNQHLLGEGLS